MVEEKAPKKVKALYDFVPSSDFELAVREGKQIFLKWKI